jgi:hypothetical protein
MANNDWTRTGVHGALAEIQLECTGANWDGEGAEPVSAETIALTMAVAAALSKLIPKGTPSPEVLPESDGEICLTWYADHEHVLSMSVGEHGNVNFAAQLGREGARHGWIPLGTTGDETFELSVQEIAGHIDRVYRAAIQAHRS